jgi:N-acetylmuramoyl-L-alanine amidase
MPAAMEGGRLRVPPELAALIRRHAELPGLAREERRPVAPAPAPKPRQQMPACKVVIDPGHGGIHTGFRGRGGLLEKDINLDVSLELRRILGAWGAEVVLTRDADGHFSTDIDEDLAARVEIVNRAKADVFVSVHTNGVANPGPRGFEVWVPLSADARGAASRHLAGLVLAELEGVWRSDNRGVKDEHHLRVLKGTRCPAVLVEMEFVSNPQAERDLARGAKRAEVAQAIAEAVRKWMAFRKR